MRSYLQNTKPPNIPPKINTNTLTNTTTPVQSETTPTSSSSSSSSITSANNTHVTIKDTPVESSNSAEIDTSSNSFKDNPFLKRSSTRVNPPLPLPLPNANTSTTTPSIIPNPPITINPAIDTNKLLVSSPQEQVVTNDTATKDDTTSPATLTPGVDTCTPAIVDNNDIKPSTAVNSSSSPVHMEPPVQVVSAVTVETTTTPLSTSSSTNSSFKDNPFLKKNNTLTKPPIAVSVASISTPKAAATSSVASESVSDPVSSSSTGDDVKSDVITTPAASSEDTHVPVPEIKNANVVETGAVNIKSVVSESPVVKETATAYVAPQADTSPAAVTSNDSGSSSFKDNPFLKRSSVKVTAPKVIKQDQPPTIAPLSQSKDVLVSSANQGETAPGIGTVPILVPVATHPLTGTAGLGPIDVSSPITTSSNTSPLVADGSTFQSIRDNPFLKKNKMVVPMRVLPPTPKKPAEDRPALQVPPFFRSASGAGKKALLTAPGPVVAPKVLPSVDAAATIESSAPSTTITSTLSSSPTEVPVVGTEEAKEAVASATVAEVVVKAEAEAEGDLVDSKQVEVMLLEFMAREDERRRTVDAEEAELREVIRKAELRLTQFKEAELKRRSAVDKEQEALVALLPPNSKYLHMKRVGVPAEKIQQRMQHEGVDSTTMAAEAAGVKSCLLRDHPVYGKYITMRNDGVELADIEKVMKKANVNVAYLHMDPGSVVASTVSIRREAPLFDHPFYSKYFKLLNSGEERQDIIAIMQLDGADVSILDMRPLDIVEYYIDVDSSLVDQYSSRPTNRLSTANNRTQSRRLHWSESKRFNAETLWNELADDNILIDKDEFDTLFRRRITQ